VASLTPSAAAGRVVRRAPGGPARLTVRRRSECGRCAGTKDDGQQLSTEPQRPPDAPGRCQAHPTWTGFARGRYDRLTLDDDGRRLALALPRLLGGISVCAGPFHPKRRLTMAINADSQATLLLTSYLGLPSGEKSLQVRDLSDLSMSID